MSSSPHKFEYDVFATARPWKAVAYAATPDSSFIVHRGQAERGDWRITHRQSSYIVARPERNTRTAALAIARRLDDLCPRAAKVAVSANGRTLTGPHNLFREEIRSALAVIASEGTPVA